MGAKLCRLTLETISLRQPKSKTDSVDDGHQLEALGGRALQVGGEFVGCGVSKSFHEKAVLGL